VFSETGSELLPAFVLFHDKFNLVERTCPTTSLRFGWDVTMEVRRDDYGEEGSEIDKSGGSGL
jgi:hypothetical protein